MVARRSSYPFALLAACGGVLAEARCLGRSPGRGALIGIGFLGALSFVLFVAALQAVVGLPGTALSAVAFIIVGNAVSGGPVPVEFSPGGFRQIAPWLPNNESSAARGTSSTSMGTTSPTHSSYLACGRLSR